jgi:hypothetical protein
MKIGIQVLLIALSILFTVNESRGQLHFGPKVGLQGFMPIYGDAERYEGISIRPDVGFNAGIAFDYKINEVFSFYTEFLYSLKGKRLGGGIRNQFINSATYHYLEMPVLARLTWKGSIKERYFKWYLNGGGTLNYWLAGNGYIESYEFHEAALDRLDYGIRFGAAPEFINSGGFNLYLPEANRIQVGLVFGGGILLDIARRRQLMIDLRYVLRHSWLGREYGVDVGLDEYYEDFRTLEHTLSISVAYLLEYNLGDRRKGKSTRGEKVKTKRGSGPPAPKRNNINRIKKH